MIARVAHASVNPADLTISSDLFRRDRLNRLRTAAGCLDVFLLVRDSREAIVIVSLWESDAAWSAFASTADSMPLGLPVDAFIRYDIALSAGSCSGAVARVHRAITLPEHVPEIVHLFENVVMHDSTLQHGFQGILLAVDREAGHGLSISFWSNRADLTVSERSGYLDDQVARVSMFLTGPPTVETFVLLRAE
jgi:heme-degrading monooxygenase HmoA